MDGYKSDSREFSTKVPSYSNRAVWKLLWYGSKPNGFPPYAQNCAVCHVFSSPPTQWSPGFSPAQDCQSYSLIGVLHRLHSAKVLTHAWNLDSFKTKKSFAVNYFVLLYFLCLNQNLSISIGKEKENSCPDLRKSTDFKINCFIGSCNN